MNLKQKTGVGSLNDPAVQAVARYALDYVKDGAKLGLGSGRASMAFIKALGQRVKDGLRVQGVPTSNASEKLARDLKIPIIELTEDLILDFIVDGADEVAPNLDLIKGWGGSLVRERIVASMCREQIILVSSEKLVQTLGERGRLPVEIIPLSKSYVIRKLKELDLVPTMRLSTVLATSKKSKAEEPSPPYFTDNGNLILDCALKSPLKDGRTARNMEARILAIVGVVDTGLFLGTCSRVLVGKIDGTVELLSVSAQTSLSRR
ncbi:MAG: ribose-5-phosphate isomerase RpiA [Planctomycetota bacterium]